MLCPAQFPVLPAPALTYDQMNFHGPQAFARWQGTSCDLLCRINWVEQRPEPRREVPVISPQLWPTIISLADTCTHCESHGKLFNYHFQWISVDGTWCLLLSVDRIDAWFCSQPGAWLRNLNPENIYKKNVVNLLWKYFGCCDPASAMPGPGPWKIRAWVWDLIILFQWPQPSKPFPGSCITQRCTEHKLVS